MTSLRTLVWWWSKKNYYLNIEQALSRMMLSTIRVWMAQMQSTQLKMTPYQPSPFSHHITVCSWLWHHREVILDLLDGILADDLGWRIWIVDIRVSGKTTWSKIYGRIRELQMNIGGFAVLSTLTFLGWNDEAACVNARLSSWKYDVCRI